MSMSKRNDTLFDRLNQKDNKSGKSALHAVLKTDLNRVEIYMKHWHLMRQEENINYEQFSSYLIQTDNVGLSPLYYATNNGSLAVFDCFLNQLKQSLSPRDYHNAIHFKINGKFFTCSLNKHNAMAINERLASERLNSMQKIQAQTINRAELHSGLVFFHKPKMTDEQLEVHETLGYSYEN